MTAYHKLSLLVIFSLKKEHRHPQPDRQRPAHTNSQIISHSSNQLSVHEALALGTECVGLSPLPVWQIVRIM